MFSFPQNWKVTVIQACNTSDSFGYQNQEAEVEEKSWGH